MATLLEKLSDCTEDEVKRVCDDLVDKRLMVFLSGKYLALAMPARAKADPSEAQPDAQAQS